MYGPRHNDKVRSAWNLANEIYDCNKLQWHKVFENCLRSLETEPAHIVVDNGSSMAATNYLLQIFRKLRRFDLKKIPMQGGKCRNRSIEDRICYFGE